MAKAREAEKERQARLFVELKKKREKEEAEHRRQVLEEIERDKAERMGKKYVPPEQKQKVYSKEENIQYFIKTIKTVYNPFRAADTLRNCFKTLKILLNNIVKNPNEDKFKTIKLTNPNIHERIGKISIALKLLEELEKRMIEYNEESEYEEDEDISKKKKGFAKKNIKKKGRKKKPEKIDDNIFLNNPNQEENSNQIKEEESNNNVDNNAEFKNGKIIISNPEFEENNMELEEESDYTKSIKSNKSKKKKKEKNKIKINISPETDEAELYNPNITI